MKRFAITALVASTLLIGATNANAFSHARSPLETRSLAMISAAQDFIINLLRRF